MKITDLRPGHNYTLWARFENGQRGYFDVKPYLDFEAFEAFEALTAAEEFKKIHNRLYYIEWDRGADLSADTIEAHLIPGVWNPDQRA